MGLRVRGFTSVAQKGKGASSSSIISPTQEFSLGQRGSAGTAVPHGIPKAAPGAPESSSNFFDGVYQPFRPDPGQWEES